MAAMSDYLENKIVDAIFRGQTFPALPTLYIGLTTNPLFDANTGANASEFAGTGGYARVALTSSLTTWMGTNSNAVGTVSTGTDGTIRNNTAITFPAPIGNWGVANSFGLFDSATIGAGNLLFYGQLTNPKTINNGDAAPSFTVNTLTIQIDN